MQGNKMGGLALCSFSRENLQIDKEDSFRQEFSRVPSISRENVRSATDILSIERECITPFKRFHSHKEAMIYINAAH